MVDVTHMAKTNLNTGIQRVVRAILNELEVITPSDIDVEPVVLTTKGGFWHYEYLNTNDERQSNVVVPREGDTFLGLDLNAQIIAAEKAGLFDDWKARGTRVVVAVHDILPITHPKWWSEEVSANHEKWLRSVLKAADTILSVSRATQDAVIKWCNENDISYQHQNFEWFHLGADMEAATPSMGMPDGADQILEQLKSRTTFLSVGTIEPRKGHEQCLEAFELLWKSGHDCNLVFVGKQGWMVEKLVERFKLHPELHKHFFWLDGISDEFLGKVYSSSDCLISPSNGEGFGIPLIEAARQGLPIIVRDIPIFREVVAEHGFYFQGQEPEALSEAVTQWLADFEKHEHIPSTGMQWQTWRQSAERIQQRLQLS
jgi:glycosyltransferase involved in cell wall biosynthesis